MLHLKRMKSHIPQLLLWLMLCICLLTVLRINFSGNPAHYQTDMYSDMVYAMRVWETKSLFPDGWVFGNQLYVLATPVVAALFYGLTSDMMLAMGLASSVMTLLVLLSFVWMLKPVLKAGELRVAVVLLMLLTLLAGDPVYALTGWQLMFTMCSYYACYLIAAFLAFGCYLRCENAFTPLLWGMTAVACVLSFAAGMQSLRQTAVMICPLLGVELCRSAWLLIKKEPLNRRALLVAGLLTGANVLGLVCVRAMPIEQVEIFGGIGLNSLSEMISSVVPSVLTAVSLLLPAYRSLLLAGVAGIVVLWGLVMARLAKERRAEPILCLLLLTLSVGAILAVDVLTDMDVRVIYYFMLFPLSAVIAAVLYGRFGRLMQGLVLAGTAGIFCVCCFAGLLNVADSAEEAQAEYGAVADYLIEQGISTVYSPWNQGEKVAIASGMALDAGFWDTADKAFQSIRYLCDPSVYDRPAEECAYLFFDEGAAQLAADMAARRGETLRLLRHFPESGIYVYTCDVNLME